MILKYGNIWSNYGFSEHKILITTNSFVKNNGELVMEKGLAKEAKEKFSDLPKKCGDMILGMNCHMKFYGMMMISKYIGIFQVKYDWNDFANLEIIKNSTKMLDKLSRRNQEYVFNLNFPGIGNGRLTYNQVFPIIKIMPNNVLVWQSKETKPLKKFAIENSENDGEKLTKELFE